MSGGDNGLGIAMRACEVKRWHTVNTSKTQTLAEHHWAVVIILLALYEAVGIPITLEIVKAALIHDIDEVWKGDIPAPRKDASYGAGHLTVMYNDEHEALLKVADSIEALWWIQNNGVGVYTREFVEANCAARQMRRIKQAADQFFGPGFESKVGGVIANLRF